MRPLTPNLERHRTQRVGWLRASVLGANDGIVSTASLILGVAAADAGVGAVLIAGLAGLVAGAMSMAAGEYVSVSSQSDAERADLKRESKELAANPEFETKELASIYQKRGLGPDLALQVAKSLMAHDALSAHARDELGISNITKSRPIQAALASAAAFAIGAALPLTLVLVVPEAVLIVTVAGASLLFLIGLGSLAALTGGASVRRGAVRVGFWGALAMGLTALIGKLFGTVV
ncbi:MAG: VIT family protein [Planctomycetes bacterium]|nr:VIT family protein [Planctomycetota bacterium]MCW8136363.1 VIT family protein [Planctomycetota bacterium]